MLDGNVAQLDPDFDMAIAWKRLETGNFKDRDITLLKHEYLELSVEKRYNLTNKQAHDIAEKKSAWDVQLIREKGEYGEDDSFDDLFK